MSWRRFGLFAALLLLAASLVGALEPRERRSGTDGSPAESSVPAAPPAPVVEARMPREAPVRARIGDVVRLIVQAPAADTVELPGLALDAPVDPDVPAQLVFVADRAGRFAVQLRETGEAIGMVVVVA